MNTVHCLQEKMFFIDGWIMIGIRTISKLTAQGECIILHLPIFTNITNRWTYKITADRLGSAVAAIMHQLLDPFCNQK